jgi:ribosomal protein S18 acetylase RimI-like enzyme
MGLDCNGESVMIEKLTNEILKDVLAQVSKAPLHNIILIADLTQLRSWCDIRVLREGSEIRAIFSLYHDLDFLAGAFWAEECSHLSELVADYGKALEKARLVFMCTQSQLEMIGEVAEKVSPSKERQMVMEDPTRIVCRNSAITHRLSIEDAISLRELYTISGTPAWTPNALTLGPFFGVGDSEGKLVSVAGVHFVTEYGSEIGNIATHPDYRRKGYAECCVAAVTQELLKDSARVLLHFFADNIAAQKLYERMGFVYSEADPVYFTRVEMK